MANELLTAKLNNGTVVLASKTKYGTYAKTYANRTQALRAADKVGGRVYQPFLGRVFYVVLEG